MQPTFVMDTAQVVAATAGPVLLVVWLEVPTAPAIRTLHDSTVALARRHPEGTAHLTFVASSASGGGVSEEVRSAVSNLMRDRDARLRAVAVVLRTEGFVGSMARSLLSSVALLARTPTAIRFVSGAEEAEKWFATVRPSEGALRLEPGGVAAGVLALRRSLGARGVKV